MEVRSPDGTWRADVMASDHGGAWRMALEAQLSPITAADITARTERMRADGVTSIWFSDRPRPPWLGVVPSVRLARPDDGQRLVIAEGLVKFNGHWEAVPATLVEFLAGRSPAASSLTGRASAWTAPQSSGRPRAISRPKLIPRRATARDRAGRRIRETQERRSREHCVARAAVEASCARAQDGTPLSGGLAGSGLNVGVVVAA